MLFDRVVSLLDHITEPRIGHADSLWCFDDPVVMIGRVVYRIAVYGPQELAHLKDTVLVHVPVPDGVDAVALETDEGAFADRIIWERGSIISLTGNIYATDQNDNRHPKLITVVWRATRVNIIG